MEEQNNIILYRSNDGKISVALFAKDGKVWLNQKQIAQLFATSKQSISYHISNIIKENELDKNSVVKEILTTASDGKDYELTTACRLAQRSHMVDEVDKALRLQNFKIPSQRTPQSS